MAAKDVKPSVPSMIGSRILGMLLTLGIFSLATGAASEPKLPVLYDHYFPKRSPYVDSHYREWFDSTIFNPAARSQLAKQEQNLYDAVRGKPDAFSAFVHSRFRGGAGEFSESWYRECVLLLLVLGDEQFAKSLAREDRKTRMLVGAALNSHIDWRRHPFPKTFFALYAWSDASGKDFFGKWKPPAPLVPFWASLDEKWWNPNDNTRIANYCKQYAPRSDSKRLLPEIVKDLKANPSVERTFVYSMLVLHWDRQITLKMLNAYSRSSDEDRRKIANDFIADIESFESERR